MDALSGTEGVRLSDHSAVVIEINGVAGDQSSAKKSESTRFNEPPGVTPTPCAIISLASLVPSIRMILVSMRSAILLARRR